MTDAVMCVKYKAFQSLDCLYLCLAQHIVSMQRPESIEVRAFHEPKMAAKMASLLRLI